MPCAEATETSDVPCLPSQPGLTRMLRWLRAYMASNDPHVSATNTIAMVLAWNQPYYPIYLWWIVGRDAWVGIPDAFSCILFFAVPAIARRSGMMGRIALIVSVSTSMRVSVATESPTTENQCWLQTSKISALEARNSCQTSQPARRRNCATSAIPNVC